MTIDLSSGNDHSSRLLTVARILLVLMMASLFLLWLVNLPEFVDRITTLNINTFSLGDEVFTSRAVIETDVAASGLSLPLYALYEIGLGALQVFMYWFVAVLILWRVENRAFGMLTALVLAGLGAIALLSVFNVTQPLQLILMSLNLISWIIWPLLFLWLFLFPNGCTRPVWAWRLTFILTAIFGLASLRGFLVAWGIVAADPLSLHLTLSGPLLVLIVVLLTLYSQVSRFRHVYSTVERQQVKWLVFVLGLVLVEVALFVVFPPETLGFYLQDLGGVVLLLIPVAIAFAILRYRLFDIDIIIRRTTSYAILTALLLLIYFGSIVVLQRLFSQITGESTVAVVLSTLLIAALFLPLRRRVQAAIDRRFFRSKYDAEQVLASFAATVRDETDLDALTAELARVIQETMQPEFVSVWLREPDKQ